MKRFFFLKTKVAQNYTSCLEIMFGGGPMDRQTDRQTDEHHTVTTLKQVTKISKSLGLWSTRFTYAIFRVLIAWWQRKVVHTWKETENLLESLMRNCVDAGKQTEKRSFWTASGQRWSQQAFSGTMQDEFISARSLWNHNFVSKSVQTRKRHCHSLVQQMFEQENC